LGSLWDNFGVSFFVTLEQLWYSLRLQDARAHGPRHGTQQSEFTREMQNAQMQNAQMQNAQMQKCRNAKRANANARKYIIQYIVLHYSIFDYSIIRYSTVPRRMSIGTHTRIMSSTRAAATPPTPENRSRTAGPLGNSCDEVKLLSRYVLPGPEAAAGRARVRLRGGGRRAEAVRYVSYE
jgi:hypothetical protein